MPEKTGEFTLLDEATLIQALVDELLAPEEACHLVGHSYGGAVALRFCHLLPSRVKTLTLFEPVAFHLLAPGDPGLEPVKAMMTELAKLLAAGLRREAVATFVDYWSGPGGFDSLPQRLQHEFILRSDKLLLDFQALLRTRLTLDDYRRLRLPVTLITGRSSRMPALRVSQQLAQALPNCRLVTVETGHMGPVTAPDLVNPIIRETLAS
jgi:pimeloyl-ACP methyl ester carboxylesterase